MNEEVTGASNRGKAFDREALAKLGRIALGGKKISDAMEQTGLSRSTISKLLNRKMSGPPSVDTLRRLAGDEHSPIFRNMLEVCGYPADLQEELNSFHSLVRNADNMSCITVSWSAEDAACTLLKWLMIKQYGTQFQIDVQEKTFFVVYIHDTKKEVLNTIKIIGVPIIVNEKACDARNVVNTAIRGTTRGIARCGLSDVVVLLLTNSPTAFSTLRNIPNLSKQMAVLLASENGTAFCEQAVIEPIEKEQDRDIVFPFELCASGKAEEQTEE